MPTNPTSTQHITHNSLDRALHALSVATHRWGLCQQMLMPPPLALLSNKTLDKHTARPHERNCVQPTSHTATHKHPHNSSSQRTDSVTTKLCHTWGMRPPHFTVLPNRTQASKHDPGQKHSHHHLACRDCVPWRATVSPKRFHEHNSQPQPFQHWKPTHSKNEHLHKSIVSVLSAHRAQKATNHHRTK